MQYPEQKWDGHLPDYYRGAPALVTDEQDRERCVSCQLCEFICPPKAIKITPGEIPSDDPWAKVEKRPKEFEIDMIRCIYCGMCEEVCPEQAIYLRKDYAITGLKRADISAVIADGQLLARYYKQKLPNYRVFDEKRYFDPGSEACVVTLGGVRCGINICADIWEAGAAERAADQLARLDALGCGLGQGFLFAKPMPDAELIGLMRTFISHAKSNCLGLDDMAARLREMPDDQFKERYRRFLEIAGPVLQAWDDALDAEHAIDFEDMLNLAADHLER